MNDGEGGKTKVMKKQYVGGGAKQKKMDGKCR